MPESKRVSAAKVFLALLKAGCYLLLFLGSQLLVSTVVTAVIAFLSPELSYEVLEAQLMEQVSLISVLSGLLTLAVLAVFFLIRRKNLLKETSLVKADLSLVGAAAAITPALYLVVSFVLALLPESLLEGYAEASSALDDIGLLAFLGTVVIAPLVEEVIFRGLIQSRLERVMPGWLSGLVAALVFGLCHGQIVWVVYAFLLGFLFGRMRLHSHSILPSLAAHIVFNLVGHLMVVLEPLVGALALAEGLLAFTVAGLIVARRQIGRLFGIGRKNRPETT